MTINELTLIGFGLLCSSIFVVGLKRGDMPGYLTGSIRRSEQPALFWLGAASWLLVGALSLAGALFLPG